MSGFQSPEGDSDAPLDVTEFFENLGGPEPRGRPRDYPGVEILSILYTLQKHNKAGKSYKPDPTKEHRAIKAADYKLGGRFLCTFVFIDSLDGLYTRLQRLSGDPTAFLIRGMLAEWAGTWGRHKSTGRTGYSTNRRTVRLRGEDGAFEDVARQLQMLDLDGVPLPAEMSVIIDPVACVVWAVEHLLPPEFQDVSFVYQLSSSAGLTKHDNQLNVHLWFFTDRPFWDMELRAWAGWWNAKKQDKIIDPALYTPVQPHYTNDPELLDGLVDPLAGRRLGLIRRRRRTVPLYMPNDAELAAERRLKVERARQSFRRATGATGGGSAETPVEHRPAKDGAVEGEVSAKRRRLRDGAGSVSASHDNDITVEGSAGNVDAVRVAPGWRGYLAMIGFEGHIRTQILAAIGSYFYEYGSRADRSRLKAAIEDAIAESPYLDSEEPRSRPRRDALGYLAAPPAGTSNVDDMIADISTRQQATERRTREVCDPTWPLPTLTADQAFNRLDEAVRQVVAAALELRRDRLSLDADPFTTPPQTAVLCEPGVGKTEAMIKAIVELLRADPGTRVAIAVPTHNFGQGLAARINERFGKRIADEWYGTEHLDPQAPKEKMCRLADAAKELISVGGKLQLLCSSRDHGHCPYHPQVAGSEACGYLRQQLPPNRDTIRVWIVPSVMLAIKPPPALQRKGPIFPGDFDLLVIDEAPWFGLLHGPGADPVGAPVEWLSPGWWQERTPRTHDRDKASAIDTLTKIHGVLSNCRTGNVPAEAFAEAGINGFNVAQAFRFVWRCKEELREFVRPGAALPDLRCALDDVAPINRRVLAVAEVLWLIRMHLQGRIAPSGIELIEHSQERNRFLRLRWRKDLHPAWLRSPVLYLDAAGTGALEIAKAWLPSIRLAVEARAKAPHMHITQIVDSQVSYGKIFRHASADNPSAGDTSEKLARFVETRGRSGLVVCPKQLRDGWEEVKRLPGWKLWNFGSIRGRDEAREVPHLVVISRPLPNPGDVETQAETIFGLAVKRLPVETMYPKSAVGRLMADGTGRRALAYRHPDPMVEAVRFAICEGELLQAIGRGRGVRRTEETPLDVVILTDVPLPLPLDVTSTWKELSDGAGPIEVLAERGVVPLDYDGIASALPSWFKNAQAVTEWFRHRPEAKARLQGMRDRARSEARIDVREFLGNLYKELSIEISQKLVAYRYRRAEDRQSKLVLVDLATHRDAPAAVETVLGAVTSLSPVKPAPQRPMVAHVAWDDQKLGLA